MLDVQHNLYFEYKYGVNLLRPLFSLKKYKTSFDDIGRKSRNPDPKNKGLFAIVGIYSTFKSMIYTNGDYFFKRENPVDILTVIFSMFCRFPG